MIMKKICFPLALTAILAGCGGETEFNPTLSGDTDKTISKIDEDSKKSSSSEDFLSSEKSSLAEKSSSSVSSSSEDGDVIVVDVFEDLVVCSAKREGVVAFVKKEKAVYTCEDNAWKADGGQVEPASSSSSSVFLPILSSSSFVMPPTVSSSSSYITPPTYYGKSYFRWDGPAGEYWVDTGLDNGTETSGYWFPFDDHVDGGLSTIIWPVALGNEYSEDALDPVIDACGGVCGTFKLDIGSLVYKPFVGVAFNVAGMKSALGDPLKDADVADVSAWRGICITYTSDVPPVLELSMGEKKDSALVAYDIPFASLPKSTTANEVCNSWAQFKQAGWGTGKISGDSIATTLATIRFKIQAADSTTGSFNIISVSSYY